MQPEEILPHIEDRDRRQDHRPDDRRDREFGPNAPTQFLVPNGRTGAQEGPHEKIRCEQHSHREFEHSGQDTHAARHLGMDEGPELFVAFGGEVGVVQLMRRAVKAEAHQAEDADEDTVEFIQQPVLAQQPVRRLVKADRHAVHEVAGDQDQRHGDPVVAAIHGKTQRRLREE